MDSRVFVYSASGLGGGGRQIVGTASGQIGQACRFHNLNCGSGSTDNEISPTDKLVISAVSGDVIYATGATSGKTYSDYAFFTSISSQDPILTATGAVDYFAGTVASGHYPYK